MWDYGEVFWGFISKIEVSAMAHHYGWEGGLSPAIYLMVNGGVTFPSSWFYSQLDYLLSKVKREKMHLYHYVSDILSFSMVYNECVKY